ncbi:hypothetical protein CTAYLR_001500 [Chrysophaeum taylorii]|uniref:Ketoreductase domain-containing protein n=1 Tax=Chrysophaeum taylorii TaxID=2483200 RepID=A0AAD7XLJ9_9STRA|nr:hypothetical protein CTAYLR_001500 [Chrysophaeum taylorii]
MTTTTAGEEESSSTLNAKWDDAFYAALQKEVTGDVNVKYCSVVEWVEQALPVKDGAIRAAIRGGRPFIPDDVIEALPSEPVQETGKMKVLAFADESGLVDEVFGMMKARKQLGSPTKKVPLWGEFADTYDKMREVVEGEWDLILFAAVDMPESNDPDDVVAWSKRIVETYLLLCQVLLRNPSYAPKVCVVSADTHSNDPETHKEAGIGISAAGPLFGMTNTVRLEVQTTAFHFVDLEYTVTDDVIAALAAELTRKTGFGEASVRLNSKGRFVARMMPAEPRYVSNAVFETPSSGTIGIGGGNGALGLVMGKYLLEHLPSGANVHIKFLSRSARVSGAGNETAWDDVRALARAKNATVEQAVCDVSSREAIETFVRDHKDTLVGFVHSAGVLRDALLPNQTSEKYDDVYKPKAWAGLYLHNALEQHQCDIKFLWMFSSVAVYGNPGQSSYSGANSLLDVVCRHRKALGKPATAMQWAGWGEVGMAANMDPIAKKRMADSPIPFFTNAQGLKGMDLGLSTGIPVFCVMRYNAKAFFDKLEKTTQKDKQLPVDRYDARFWSRPIPPQQLTELDLYDVVSTTFAEPRELIYDHFTAGVDYPDQ